MIYNIDKIIQSAKEYNFKELFDTFYINCLTDKDKVNFMNALSPDNIILICDLFAEYLSIRRNAISQIADILKNEKLSEKTKQDIMKEFSSKVEADEETLQKFNTFMDFCMLHHDGK